MRAYISLATVAPSARMPSTSCTIIAAGAVEFRTASRSMLLALLERQREALGKLRTLDQLKPELAAPTGLLASQPAGRPA